MKKKFNWKVFMIGTAGVFVCQFLIALVPHMPAEIVFAGLLSGTGFAIYNGFKY